MRSTDSASGKSKKGKGIDSDKKKNLEWIADQVDAAEKRDLLEEETALLEEGEEKEGGIHLETPHKGASRHREQETVNIGINPKQD